MPTTRTSASVGDVIVTKDGKIDAVVVDVGGFLGIGEKPVAIAFDDLKIVKDENGNLVAYTTFTKDQLDNAPPVRQERVRDPARHRCACTRRADRRGASLREAGRAGAAHCLRLLSLPGLPIGTMPPRLRWRGKGTAQMENAIMSVRNAIVAGAFVAAFAAAGRRPGGGRPTPPARSTCAPDRARDYHRILTIPAGARINVHGCSSWCSVDYRGRSGYVSASYVSRGYAPAPQPLPPAAAAPRGAGTTAARGGTIAITPGTTATAGISAAAGTTGRAA